MKIRNLICAGAILLSFMACSQDDVNGPQGGNENGEGAYMSLAISMPNAPGTRAIDPGKDTEVGTNGEQKVTSLLVLCYDVTNGTAITDYKKTYTAAELVPQNPNPSDDTKATTYVVPEFKITKGPKKVVVIVNPLKDQFSETMSLASMRESMSLTTDQITLISTDNSFLMTNANDAVNQDANGSKASITPTQNGEFYEDGSVYVDVQGTKEHPTNVTIPVERAVAKIQDVTNSYDFEVKVDGTANGEKVTFTDVALINGNTKFFPIKNIRNSNTEGKNDYVVDPNFSETEQKVVDFYSKIFKVTETETKIDVEFKSLTSMPIFYTLENTMHKDQQMNGYTTGLYYKAVYTAKDGTKDENVYKYLGKVYNFTQLQSSDLKLEVPAEDDNSKIELTDDSSAEDFAKIGVTKYEKGVCYYPYWIRHVPSSDVMGIMEFGVVRNNVYKMTINSVKGIGTPTPENPDPDTPNETDDVILQVSVKVLPWTVRNNGIDF